MVVIRQKKAHGTPVEEGSIGSIVVAIWSGANEINEEGSRNAVWDHKESFSEKRLEVLTCCVFWETGPW